MQWKMSLSVCPALYSNLWKKSYPSRGPTNHRKGQRESEVRWGGGGAYSQTKEKKQSREGVGLFSSCLLAQQRWWPLRIKFMYACLWPNKNGNVYSDRRDNDVKPWASLMDFFASSVNRRTAPSVTLVFITGERCSCKKRRGRYQFPISRVNRDISISIINADVSNLNAYTLNWNTGICI